MWVFKFLEHYAKKCQELDSDNYAGLPAAVSEGKKQVIRMMVLNEYDIVKIHTLVCTLLPESMLSMLSRVSEYFGGMFSEEVVTLRELQRLDPGSVQIVSDISNQLPQTDNEDFWGEHNIEIWSRALLSLSGINRAQFDIMTGIVKRLPVGALSLYAPILEHLYKIATKMDLGETLEERNICISNIARVISRYLNQDDDVPATDKIASRLMAISDINPQATDYIAQLYHDLMAIPRCDHLTGRVHVLIDMLCRFAELPEQENQQVIAFITKILNPASLPADQNEIAFLNSLISLKGNMAELGMLDDVDAARGVLHEGFDQLIGLLDQELTLASLREINTVIHTIHPGFLKLLKNPIFGLSSELHARIDTINRLQACEKENIDHVIESLLSFVGLAGDLPSAAAHQVSNLSISSSEALIAQFAVASRKLKRVSTAEMIKISDAIFPLEEEQGAPEGINAFIYRHQNITSSSGKFLLQAYLLSEYYDELSQVAIVVNELTAGDITTFVQGAKRLADIPQERFDALLAKVWLGVSPEEYPPLYQKLMHAKELAGYHEEFDSIYKSYISLQKSEATDSNVVDRIFLLMQEVRKIDGNRFNSFLRTVHGANQDCDELPHMLQYLQKIQKIASNLPEDQIDSAKANVKSLLAKVNNAAVSGKNHISRNGKMNAFFDVLNYAKTVNIAKNVFIGSSIIGAIIIACLPSSYIVICPTLFVILLVAIGLFIAELVALSKDVKRIDVAQQALSIQEDENHLDFAFRLTRAFIAPGNDATPAVASELRAISSNTLLPIGIGVAVNAMKTLVCQSRNNRASNRSVKSQLELE